MIDALNRPEIALKTGKQIENLVHDWAMYTEADIETLQELVAIAWDDLQREASVGDMEGDDDPSPVDNGDYPY